MVIRLGSFSREVESQLALNAGDLLRKMGFWTLLMSLPMLSISQSFDIAGAMILSICTTGNVQKQGSTAGGSARIRPREQDWKMDPTTVAVRDDRCIDVHRRRNPLKVT